MLKKILKEIIMFFFDLGLMMYFFLWYSFLNFFINLFDGKRIAKIFLFILENTDRFIEKVGTFIIKKLEKKDMWY